MKAPPTMQEIKEQTFITRRIKVRSVERKDWQRMDPPGGGWGLFGYHTIPNEKPTPTADDKKNRTMRNEPREEREIIITEGEYDAMAVWQATHRPAISLPNGCRSLPVEVLPLLEDFTKIYLWMDNDAAGQDGAEQFAKKLGLQRCYIVRPTFSNCRLKSSSPANDKDPKKKSALTSRPSPHEMVKQLPKDANDALRQGLDLSLILADAQLVRHDRIIRFSDLRDEVLHEIMHPDQYVGHPMKSLPGFTNIIKGFRRGELSVITGPTGSGKTTFLGQLSVDLVEQDVNVLWGSFEIKNIRLIHKLMQQFAREPLPTGDPSMKDKLEALSDRFDRLPLTFMKFHGGTDVDDVLDAMDYAVYVNDVEHIILDNMQFMVSLNSLKGKGSSSSFDKFDVQDMAIEKFRKFATDRNVHIMLVVHPKKEAENANLSISSIYGTAKATQEADTVLILQNDGRRKFLEVKKNRFNGTLGHTPLHFDRKSCRYGEVPVVNVSGSDSSSNSSPSTGGGPSSNSRSAYNNSSAISGQRQYAKRPEPTAQPTIEGKDNFMEYYMNSPTTTPTE
jgi:twinkle protein